MQCEKWRAGSCAPNRIKSKNMIPAPPSRPPSDSAPACPKSPLASEKLKAVDRSSYCRWATYGGCPAPAQKAERRYQRLRVQDSECKSSGVEDSGFRVQGPRFRVQGSGFRAQGPRFRGQNPQCEGPGANHNKLVAVSSTGVVCRIHVPSPDRTSSSDWHPLSHRGTVSRDRPLPHASVPPASPNS